jgi:hypothetical protein
MLLRGHYDQVKHAHAHLNTGINTYVVLLAPGRKIPTKEELGWSPPWTTVTIDQYAALPEAPENVFNYESAVAASQASYSSSPTSRTRITYNKTGGKLLAFIAPQTATWKYDSDDAATKHFATVPMRNVMPGDVLPIAALGYRCSSIVFKSDPHDRISMATGMVPGLLQLFRLLDEKANLFAYRKEEDLEVLEAVFKLQTYSEKLEELILKHKLTPDELEAALSMIPLLGNKMLTEDVGARRIRRSAPWFDSSDKSAFDTFKPFEVLLTEARRQQKDHRGTVLLDLWDSKSNARKRLMCAAALARIVLKKDANDSWEPNGSVKELLAELVTKSPIACLYSRERMSDIRNLSVWGYLIGADDKEIDYRTPQDQRLKDMLETIDDKGLQEVMKLEGEASK